MITTRSFFLGALFAPFMALVVLFALMIPAVSHAAVDDLEVTGWIPYWAKTAGTKSALKNLNTLDTIYPFVYTVKQDGSLIDNGHLAGKEWQTLFKAARKKDVEIIPTITSGDGAMIHSILSDTKKRKAHINEIVSAVKKGKFDGIDIDYESRTKVTIDYFSVFLGELKLALGKDKTLVCTLEPRTPPDSLWKEVPNPLPYSNDYHQIGMYCDVIQIMTYDQQRADIKLNDARSGTPYFPNADPDWVEKVMQETEKGLPKDKLMLGVATYGRHMGVTVSPNWFQGYAQLGAVNRPDALAIAKREKVEPATLNGEQVITYLPKTMPKKIATAVKKMKVPKGTQPGMKVAAQALAYANKTGETLIINMAWWSDADSIEDKVELADERGWRGLAVFKIDGEEDSGMWRMLR